MIGKFRKASGSKILPACITLSCTEIYLVFTLITTVKCPYRKEYQMVFRAGLRDP